MTANGNPNPRDVVARRMNEYRQQRLSYYSARNSLLTDLLKKDPFIPALRGVRTAHGWLDEAFQAHESSSEETVMGNTWQSILGDLTRRSVGGSDFLFEKDDILWVLEVKTQTNTINAGGLIQILRSLKEKVRLHLGDRVPGRRGVRPGIGILRGTPTDVERNFQSTGGADRDIDGFQYRYMIGSSFLSWLTGMANPAALIDLAPGDTLLEAREACRSRLHAELSTLLTNKSLLDEVSSVVRLSEEVHAS